MAEAGINSPESEPFDSGYAIRARFKALLNSVDIVGTHIVS